MSVVADTDDSRPADRADGPGVPRTPPLLWLYAVLMLQPLVMAVTMGRINGPVLAAMALTAFMVWRLLNGSRIAWILGVAIGLSVLLSGAGIPVWSLALNVLALACLFSPDVRAYVTAPSAGTGPDRMRQLTPKQH